MNANQLRASILQMAIEGKLVPQLDSEPAVEQLGNAQEDVPFDIPEKWKWVYLSNVGRWKSGGTPDRSKKEYYDNGNIPWLKTGDLNDGFINSVDECITQLGLDNSSAHINPTGSVLIAMYGATIGKLGILNIPCATNQACCACVTEEKIIFNKFLFYYLLSQRRNLIALGAGSGQPNISKTKIINYLIALPPLEEQKRIVAKLEQLLPLVDEYGKAYEKLEELNAEFPDKLKASVLQSAIKGQLVPQLDSEPAVEQIGKAPEDVPFNIPEKWKWLQLNLLAEYVQRGKSPTYSDIESIPVISQKCNQWDGFHIEPAKFINPDTLSKYKKERFVQDNDLLWNSTGLGTIGRVALYKSELNPYKIAVVDSHVTIVRPNQQLLNPLFLYYYLSSATVQNSIEDLATGSTKQKELGLTTIKAYLTPLPPLEEQKRIVAKVEELFALIDAMKK